MALRGWANAQRRIGLQAATAPLVDPMPALALDPIPSIIHRGSALQLAHRLASFSHPPRATTKIKSPQESQATKQASRGTPSYVQTANTPNHPPARPTIGNRFASAEPHPSSSPPLQRRPSSPSGTFGPRVRGPLMSPNGATRVHLHLAERALALRGKARRGRPALRGKAGDAGRTRTGEPYARGDARSVSAFSYF